MSVPIFYIKNGKLNFGNQLIFNNIEIYIHKKDKICLIGSNGSGKSSLMKIISQKYLLNEGEIYKNPSSLIYYLRQETPKYNGKVIDIIMSKTKKDKFEVQMILDKLKIPEENFQNLSGGMQRRVLLAEALIMEPDILLLDEPTNHLDITSIEWLESYIKSYKGAVICISHDKSFLSNVTNRLWWIHKSNLYKSDKGFKYFEEWEEEILLQESRKLNNLEKKLEQEKTWLSQGVTGRRKRNQQRLANLYKIREKFKQLKYNQKNQFTDKNIEQNDVKKSKFILEANNISYKINNKTIIKDFNIRIQKGERIGIIGENGSGKTTLIKILIQELKPTEGLVKIAKNLDITYFDQSRSDLIESDTIKKNLIPQGGDHIFLEKKTIHIGSYIKNFMINPKMVNDPVSTLSGGQKNRVILAKKLINPGNLLVLDEPTNDLDMNTVELLLNYLDNYKGTIILISHDRDFLDQLVTRTIIISQNKIHNIIGGYQEWRKYNNLIENKKRNSKNNKIRNKIIEQKKLSYNQQRLFEILPQEIEKLEEEIKKLEFVLESDSNLYHSDKEKFNNITTKIKKLQDLIQEKEEEWLKIVKIQDNIKTK